MWEHRCSHANKDGSRCKRTSTQAVWAFNHEGFKYDRATWAEYCGHHVTDASSIVSMMSI